jgi:hypothetical protein
MEILIFVILIFIAFRINQVFVAMGSKKEVMGAIQSSQNNSRENIIFDKNPIFDSSMRTSFYPVFSADDIGEVKKRTDNLTNLICDLNLDKTLDKEDEKYKKKHFFYFYCFWGAGDIYDLMIETNLAVINGKKIRESREEYNLKSNKINTIFYSINTESASDETVENFWDDEIEIEYKKDLEKQKTSHDNFKNFFDNKRKIRDAKSTAVEPKI